MIRLTRILSKHLYRVDLDSAEVNRRLTDHAGSERSIYRRRSSKKRTRHLSLREHRHKSTGSASSREDIVTEFGVRNADSKPMRRPMSIHQDMASFVDTKLLGSGQSLFNFVSNGFSGGASSIHSGSLPSGDEEEDQFEEADERLREASELTTEDVPVRTCCHVCVLAEQVILKHGLTVFALRGSPTGLLRPRQFSRSRT
jgi:hypothetical protein